MDCLRRVVRALQTASRARSRNAKLTGAQLWVLQQIAKTPGISLTQLAAQTLTNASTASEMAAKMVSSGYVKRVSHRSDGRRIHLTLTARGTAVLRGLPQPVQDKLANALLSLPPQKLSRLADAFEDWITEARLLRTPATLLNTTSGIDREQ
jgi:MarR family transcriptional regulator, organic hydroperoxide resistance regulator